MSKIPRCEAIPVPDHAFSLRVDGIERTRWHFAPTYPGPFFYPLLGPSGEPLTRMGHPGAQNHDHHRSVWFAHNKVMGIDFWSMNMPGTIRQHLWYVLEDGDDACGMAVELHWLDGHDPRPLLKQELVAFLRPLDGGEYTLDLQSTFRPTAAELELEMTNFGFFAIRVAKSLSGHFGGGTITGSSGKQGESELFGTPNAWMDYSGPVPVVQDDGSRTDVVEGITCFDHPQNPNHPAKWHVREDGWMGPSVCRDSAILVQRDEPLVLRYLLHVHSGPVEPARTNQLAADWLSWLDYRVVKSSRPHRQFEIERL
ncbi:MAG: PmoA family protein [Planctomycetaceae bacterium]|nr:PmoA family protein [Planctomycetaceae bacterium]